MNFRKLEAALPEELVDSIARMAHKNQMSVVLPSMVDRICHAEHKTAFSSVLPDIHSILRTLLSNGEDTFIENIRDLFPDFQYYVDAYFHWYTAFIFLTDEHVIMFHKYYATSWEHDYYVCEATLRDNIFSVKCVASNNEYPLPEMPLEFLRQQLLPEDDIILVHHRTVAPPQITNWSALENSIRAMVQ